MISNSDKVKYFMETFNQDVEPVPKFPTMDIQELRIELIREELEELRVAIEDKNLVEVADALADILYVTYGAAHSFGIPIDACFNEVQRSNMSKLDENGKPIYRSDGKIMKGINYSKPDLKSVLQTGLSIV